MSEYSVEEVRAHAAILRDWRNGFDPGVGNDDAAGMLDAHADLLERIKADESAEVRLADYLKSQSGYVCLNDQARRNVANTFLAVAYPDHPPAQAAQVDSANWFAGKYPTTTEPAQPADSGRVGGMADLLADWRRAADAHDEIGFGAAADVGRTCADDLEAALAAQGQGEPVAWLVTRDHDRTFPHVYISESSADAVVEWVTLPPFANKVPLYTAPPASPVGVPDALRVWAMAEGAPAGDPMYEAARGHVREMLKAAPSAPEGDDHA